MRLSIAYNEGPGLPFDLCLCFALLNLRPGGRKDVTRRDVRNKIKSKHFQNTFVNIKH